MIYLLYGVLGLTGYVVVLGLWSCLSVASDADDAAEETFREMRPAQVRRMEEASEWERFWTASVN